MGGWGAPPVQPWPLFPASTAIWGKRLLHRSQSDSSIRNTAYTTFKEVQIRPMGSYYPIENFSFFKTLAFRISSGEKLAEQQALCTEIPETALCLPNETGRSLGKRATLHRQCTDATTGFLPK